MSNAHLESLVWTILEVEWLGRNHAFAGMLVDFVFRNVYAGALTGAFHLGLGAYPR